jgi:hypothetical protein
MKHLHLLITDLFPAQDIAAEVCAGLQLPALEKLLARGNASAAPVATLEDWLCTAFGVQSVAPVRAAADGLDVGEAYWLCADPVSLQLQRAQILVLPEAMPGKEDAESVCAALNVHFAEAGLRFAAPHSQRWYVQVEAEPQMTTSPLRQVVWRDAKFFQPQGADALCWQRIVTEMQMLLYAHPLNQAREARGEAMINSLWLWGGGRAEALQKVFEAFGGDSSLAAAFAQTAGVVHAGSLQTMLDGQQASGLWVCVAAGDAQRCGDLYAWREAVQRIEQEVAQPLLKALQAGRLQRLTLEVLRENGSQRFSLTRGDSWKLWRPERSLARYAV